MKIPNLFILNSLYNGDPKVTPLTLGWLEYTVKVKEVIVNEFVKEIGAEPVKNSPLDLRISKAAKNFAKIARKHFRIKKGNYKRATAQHFFKVKTHIRLRNEKKKKATPQPNPGTILISSIKFHCIAFTLFLLMLALKGLLELSYIDSIVS